MGCFDTVKFNCPFCKETTDVQTKVDICAMIVYEMTDVPANIASELNGTIISCGHCHAAYMLQAIDEIKNIKMGTLAYYKPLEE